MFTLLLVPRLHLMTCLTKRNSIKVSAVNISTPSLVCHKLIQDNQTRMPCLSTLPGCQVKLIKVLWMALEDPAVSERDGVTTFVSTLDCNRSRQFEARQCGEAPTCTVGGEAAWLLVSRRAG